MKSLMYVFALFGWFGTAQAQPLKWQDRRFSIDECGIRYNGQPLPLGQDTMEWVRVLGPPDRRLPWAYWMPRKYDIGYMVWDSHGLALDLRIKRDTVWVHSALFFFLGMDSEEGKNLSLSENSPELFGFKYDPISSYDEEYLRQSSEEYYVNTERFHADHRSFPYPVTPVRSQVRLDGLLLSPQMRMEQLNPLRDAMGLPRFAYEASREFTIRHPKTSYFNIPGYLIDSTVAGSYLLEPTRSCQGMTYGWTLRYSIYKRLIHLRVNTYRPWENEALLASQKRRDLSRIQNVSGYKDGDKLFYRLQRLEREKRLLMEPKNR
jgi:hypothetical protein